MAARAMAFPTSSRNYSMAMCGEFVGKRSKTHSRQRQCDELCGMVCGSNGHDDVLLPPVYVSHRRAGCAGRKLGFPYTAPDDLSYARIFFPPPPGGVRMLMGSPSPMKSNVFVTSGEACSKRELVAPQWAKPVGLLRDRRQKQILLS